MFRVPIEIECSLKPFYPIVIGSLWNLLSNEIQTDIIKKHLGLIDFYIAIVLNIPQNDNNATGFKMAELKSNIDTTGIDYYVFASEEIFERNTLPEFAYILFKVATITVLNSVIVASATIFYIIYLKVNSNLSCRFPAVFLPSATIYF